MKSRTEQSMERLCEWVRVNTREIFNGTADFSTCPKDLYLGYMNDWSSAEMAVNNFLKLALKRAGLDWRDYYDYDVDSSD